MQNKWHCIVLKWGGHKNSWCPFHALEFIKKQGSRFWVGWMRAFVLEGRDGAEEDRGGSVLGFPLSITHTFLLLPASAFLSFPLNFLPPTSCYFRLCGSELLFPAVLPRGGRWVRASDTVWADGETTCVAIVPRTPLNFQDHTSTYHRGIPSVIVKKSPIYKHILVCQVKDRIPRIVLIYLFWFSIPKHLTKN